MRVKAIGRIDFTRFNKRCLSRLDNATRGYRIIFSTLQLHMVAKELGLAVKKIGTKIKNGKLDAKDVNKELLRKICNITSPQPSLI
ncbi:MAG: hypothetical protein CM1200mP23_3290 [Nitrososphaerota archaeon]|nr:MAG: hypothetical protein CM1200mP23_3290 [Nitrososphaerota archaeon]